MQRLITVMFWNVWGHRQPHELNAYLESMRNSVDLFCFTEVTACKNPNTDRSAVVHTSTSHNEPPSHINGKEQLQALLGEGYTLMYSSPDYRTWECKQSGNKYNEIGFGSALIPSTALKTIEVGAVRICDKLETVRPRIMQWAVLEVNKHRYLIAHLHGVWIADNTKGDDPARFEQSLQIRDKLERISDEYGADKIIFGGDLNLAMDTLSLRLLVEGEGLGRRYRNLIEEYGIESTRTPLYRKFGQPGESGHADYILVSRNVNVHVFNVENAVLGSDHAPLMISFS